MDEYIEMVMSWQKVATDNIQFSLALAALAFLMGAFIMCVLRGWTIAGLKRNIAGLTTELTGEKKLLLKSKSQHQKVVGLHEASIEKIVVVEEQLEQEREEHQLNVSAKDVLFLASATGKKQEIDALNTVLTGKGQLVTQLQDQLTQKEGEYTSQVSQYDTLQAQAVEMEKEISLSSSELVAVKQQLKAEQDKSVQSRQQGVTAAPDSVLKEGLVAQNIEIEIPVIKVDELAGSHSADGDTEQPSDEQIEKAKRPKEDAESTVEDSVLDAKEEVEKQQKIAESKSIEEAVDTQKVEEVVATKLAIADETETVESTAAQVESVDSKPEEEPKGWMGKMTGWMSIGKSKPKKAKKPKNKKAKKVKKVEKAAKIEKVAASENEAPKSVAQLDDAPKEEPKKGYERFVERTSGKAKPEKTEAIDALVGDKGSVSNSADQPTKKAVKKEGKKGFGIFGKKKASGKVKSEKTAKVDAPVVDEGEASKDTGESEKAAKKEGKKGFGIFGKKKVSGKKVKPKQAAKAKKVEPKVVSEDAQAARRRRDKENEAPAVDLYEDDINFSEKLAGFADAMDSFQGKIKGLFGGKK